MDTPKSRLLIAAVELRAVRDALQLIAAGGTVADAGRRALLLAFIIAPETIGTQAALAKRLGVSRARVTQMLNTMRKGFANKTARELTCQQL